MSWRVMVNSPLDHDPVFSIGCEVGFPLILMFLYSSLPSTEATLAVTISIACHLIGDPDPW